ncbi:MAG: transposase, partial [Bacteroidales bacterium]|nr:transposase [Bacteroidales bacterium]
LEKKIAHQDAIERNAIEGKFGEGKRKYGLGRISARLQTTSETVIALQFLVMNLEKVLRDTFLSFFQIWKALYLFVNRKKYTLIIEK